MGKRCGNCANGTWLKGMDAVPEVCLECKYVHAEPSNWKEKVQTNADRIRAMNDEELAVFLEQTQADVAFNNKSKYAFEWERWLKQPAE